MKKIALLLLSVLLLAGCRERAVSVSAEQPASGVPGYYALSQQLSGGAGAQANLKEISVARRQEETIVSLIFDAGLPSYCVDGLADPSRLVLRMSLAGKDFAGQEIEQEGLYLGSFYEEIDGETRLYLQFKGNIAYKIRESGNELLVYVRADDLIAGEEVYVRLPYSQEILSFAREMELTPALCEDGVTLTCISRPFADRQSAEQFRQELEDRLVESSLSDTPQLSVMERGASPKYLEPISRTELDALGALLHEDGSVSPAEVFYVGARFLCWMPDGETALIACPSGEDASVEEVWTCGPDGTALRLFEGEFSSLQKADVSQDSRYIALIEQLEGSRLVYVYDSAEGALELLSTQGFGDFTTDIAWSAANKLYAMTGDDVMQLMVYDPALSGSETSSVSAVEEREGTYGTVGCAGGWVYFTDEFGDILRANPDTASRELFVPGDSFWLSPDGAYAAVVLYVDQEDGRVSSYINVYTPAAEQVCQLEIASPLLNACWDRDGKTLYYLLANYEGNAEYPSELFRLDAATGESTSLGKLAGNNIYIGSGSGELMLVAYLEHNGELRPVCYMLKTDR